MGGHDKHLHLFHVDGEKNARLQSVRFADMPVYSAFFINGGREAIATGRRPFFYSFDVERCVCGERVRVRWRED